MTTIDELHGRLNYEAYEPRLKAVTGFYARLVAMRRKATTPSGLAMYTSLLERGIESLKKKEALEAPMEAKAIIRAGQEWVDQWDRECKKTPLGIRQPEGYVEWVQKWHPEVASAFESAFSGWMALPSLVRFKALTQATEALHEAYRIPEGVDGR